MCVSGERKRKTEVLKVANGRLGSRHERGRHAGRQGFRVSFDLLKEGKYDATALSSRILPNNRDGETICEIRLRRAKCCFIGRLHPGSS